MLRTILAVILAVAITHAQSQSATPRTDPIWAYIEAKRTQSVLVYPEYLGLRRGTEEAVYVEAKIEPSSPSADSSYWGAPAPRNGRLAPTELRIEIVNGFTARSIRYEHLRKVSFGTETPDLVLGPYSAEFRFMLRADRDLALGDHVLKGKLRFQRVNKAGVSEPQELDFDIPVHVVEHKAKVAKNDLFPWEVTLGEKILIIVLWPIIFPWALGNGC